MDVFDCINKKVKEKQKKEREEKQRMRSAMTDLQIELEDFFSKLAPNEYYVDWKGYVITIYIGDKHLFVIRSIQIIVTPPHRTGQYQPDELYLDQLAELAHGKHDILKEIAKKYGCV